MRTLLVLAALTVVAFACQPPCEPVSVVPTSVCFPADGGTLSSGTPFTLQGETYFAGGTCAVTVDGGRIDLLVNGNSCGTANGASAVRAQPMPVPCAIPALPDGTYTVNSQVPVTFTFPASDAGSVPSCFP